MPIDITRLLSPGTSPYASAKNAGIHDFDPADDVLEIFALDYSPK
jgi:hypothetical protein